MRPNSATVLAIALPQRFRLHLDREARRELRRHIGGVLDDAGLDEMLVQMVDIFDHPAFLGAGYAT
jgi:hypothetical protein